MKGTVPLKFQAETATKPEALRTSAQRGRPFSIQTWVGRIAKRLGLESLLQSRRRPKGPCGA